MTRELVIDGQRIADDTDAFVVAEIGNNHGGSLDTCKAMILAAKDCGASAVKLQKRDLATLYTPEELAAPYNSEHAYGPTYGAHRAALEFDAAQYRALQLYARELRITLFATAFDRPSLALLKELDMPAIKIGSGQAVDVDFIRAAAWCGQPVIVSTGGLTMDQVCDAYGAIFKHRDWGRELDRGALLQCTSLYPCEAEDLQLRVIETMRLNFPRAVIGLSDHYPKPNLAIAAYALGARIVEKHFTLNRAWKGTDHAFSLEPDGLRTLVNHLRETRRALGDGVKRAFDAEGPALRKMGRRTDLDTRGSLPVS